MHHRVHWSVSIAYRWIGCESGWETQGIVILTAAY
jgi:hypothetical protein